MRKTGELLRKSREASGFTLSEVALATKINPKILTAIENGDDSNLPAKTFLKGFVRSYALFLKMDPEEVMAVFLSETGGAAPQPVHEAYRQPEPTPAVTNNRRNVHEENSSAMRTGAVVVIVVLIALIMGVRELIEKYQRERVMPTNEVKVIPLLPQMSEPATVTNVKPLQVEEPVVVAEKQEVQAEKPKNKPVASAPSENPVPPANHDAKPVPAAPALSMTMASPLPLTGAPGVTVVKTFTEEPAPTPKAKPAEVKPTKVDTAKLEPAHPKEEKAPEQNVKAEDVPKADARAEISKIVHSEIIVEALDNVELKFRMHGESKRISLGPTEVHTIVSDEPLDLEISDGGAVNLIVNGRDRGPIGELGKAKQVKVP